VRERSGLPRGLLALCLVVAVLATLPVAVTIVQAIEGGFSAVSTALRAHSTGRLLLHSLEVAVVATPVATVIGVAAAWFVERTRLPLRWLWAVLLVAPLTIPPFVTSYAWASLGTSLQGFWGASGLIAFTYFPIVFLLVAVALRGLDPALEETARSLGLNGTQTFFRVILPQLRPAVLGGMLLVALDTFVEFDAFVGIWLESFLW
jgi:iron(III) transport system permease protein